MEIKTISFSANDQVLTKESGSDNFVSNAVSYVKAEFSLGTGWTRADYNTVNAVWHSVFATISTVLDANNSCMVPVEMLAYNCDVYVNLVGTVVEDDTVSYRLTTEKAKAFAVNKIAEIEGSETTEITPSQFEQFVNEVRAEAEAIDNYTYDSEAWAKGTRAGVPVASTDPTYHNNSKYYADQGAALEQEVTDLKSDLGFVGKFIEDGQGAGYYKSFSALSANTTYKFVVTAHTSGTYELNFATAGDSSTIVDTISGLSLTANAPYVVRYTPSVGTITHARLWLCDNWDIKIYEAEALSDVVENVEELSADNKNVIDTAFTKVKNKNLFDKNNVKKDQYYNSSGNLLTLSGWDTSNPIPVKSGKTYYFSYANEGVRATQTMWYLILFSENDEMLDYDNTGLTSYTPQSDGVLYFTWKYASTKSDFFCGEISDPNYYDEYGYSYISKEAEKTVPYKGVVWACVGDSLTEHNVRANKHYYDYISEELGFSLLNYGVSGSGYAAQKDINGAFYQRILNINEDFDVLTIFGSVNDMAVIQYVPLGTYTDTGTSTIGGCINTAIDNFYTIAPFKKLGIISQPPSIGTTPDGELIGTVAQDYNDLLAQICANRSIPFLNLFNSSGLRPWDSDFREEYYNEGGIQDTGVHPNSKGQKILSTKIREFIKSII